MADLTLKMVIDGSNDGAIVALKQVVREAQAASGAIATADQAGAFSKTRKGVESISQQLAAMKSQAIAVFSASAIVDFARQIASASDEVKGIESRVRLASRSWNEYSQTLAGVRQIAYESGSAVAANVALVNRISDPVRAMGGAQGDILGITKAVNDALRIGNASTVEATATMLQFAQAIGSGVLNGDELKSTLENSPRLAKALADGLGVTVGQLREMGAAGALTSQQVVKALQSQQAALSSEAATLPRTVGQAWVNAGEAMKVYIAETDKGLGLTSAFASALNSVAKNIPAIGNGMALVAVAMGAAWGSNMVARIAAMIAAQKTKIEADRLSAAAGVRAAEVELAVAQAVAQKSAAELRSIAVTTSYTLATNEAAAAAGRRAAAEAMAAANQRVGAANMALTSARAIETAASVGLLGRALAGAGVAARGVMAFFGGPIGLAVTAIMAATAAWELFGKKGKEAVEEVQIPVDKLIKDFLAFSQKSGENELEQQLIALQQRAGDLHEQLMNPGFRQSSMGQAATEDLKALEEVIVSAEGRLKKFREERAKVISEMVAEKGVLGIAGMKVSTGGLIDADSEKRLTSFQALYSAFIDKAVTESGALKVSALEARAAIEKLLSSAKTPADFTNAIGALMSAGALDPKSATIKSSLETAIEGRFNAERKALDSLVSGLEAKAQRTQALFARTAQIALAQFSQAAALQQAVAELSNDTKGVSDIAIKNRNAEVTVAVQAANMEIGALEQAAQRKRQIVSEDAAAVAASARAEIEAAQQVRDKRLKVAEDEVAAGKRTSGSMADYRIAQENEFLQKTAPARAARLAAEGEASRKIAEIDGQTAQQRATIAEGLYKTIQAKAQDALSQYKTYAQQVIQLDQKIATNRLDTYSAIAQLQRTDMSPQQQVASLREELQQLQAATADAMATGQRDYALELLSRQKQLAQQIGQASGDGVDKQKQIKEGVDLLQQIGGQADSILAEQRAAAEAAAQAQLQAYQDMATALNGLAQQITALNANSAIKLKAEIDGGSLDAAVAAVKAAFAGVTVPIKVQTSGLPDSTATVPDNLPARKYGGPLPGSAPNDTADNMLYWGTPGEWVIRLAAVRYYGPELLAAINSMRLPKYASGGSLARGSAINRLSIPSLSSSAPVGNTGTPLVLDFGELGRHEVSISNSGARDLLRTFKRVSLARGKH